MPKSKKIERPNIKKKKGVLALTPDWNRPGSEGKYGGVGWYRIINPYEKLPNTTVMRDAFAVGGPERALKMALLGDIWVMRVNDDWKLTLVLLADAKFAGCKIVVDLDDHPFETDPMHPKFDYFEEHKETFRMFIENADAITVSTESLKNTILPYNKNVYLLPNAIDQSIWNVKPRRLKKYTKKKGTVRIGWFGSGSHMADIPVIQEAMKIVLEKYPHVEFHMAGIIMDDQETGRVFHHVGTKGYEEYPQFIADMRLDIAIAPIKDTVFNRDKSNIKFLEHAMLEIPMVLSDVEPYRRTVTHYKDGYLAKNTSEWVKYLSWLIENPQKRKQIGKSAKKTALKYTVDKVLPEYQNMIDELHGDN